MTKLWYTFAILLCSTLLRTSQAQQPHSDFIVPNEISEEEDIFIYNHMEYVFVKSMISYSTANTLCKHKYRGRLAHVKTVELADFLAEALSETNLGIAVIWIGGQYKGNSWHWTEDTKIPIQISPEITQMFVNYSQSIETNDRKCLAIGRKVHLIPQFPTFNCAVSRPYMCERSISGDVDATHAGWIRFDNLLYKIFSEKVPWEIADLRCFTHDNDSSLAYIPNYAIAQQLGRHLLIGRPSLENAWIGASFINNNYQFGEINVILSNDTDAFGYPPWLYGTITKPHGCILLDRHLSNITNFVEARCESPRPYICYKNLYEIVTITNDIFIDELGYRVYSNKLPWQDARSQCNIYKPTYGAQLVEIRERRIVDHLLYIMGENKTAINHIWLGGLYNAKTEVWEWDSDNSEIQIENVLDWVKNETYVHDIERVNTCLNMDRENFIHPLHYGTNCDYAQKFVCVFPKEKLIQLQNDEASQG